MAEYWMSGLPHAAWSGGAWRRMVPEKEAPAVRWELSLADFQGGTQAAC